MLASFCSPGNTLSGAPVAPLMASEFQIFVNAIEGDARAVCALDHASICNQGLQGGGHVGVSEAWLPVRARIAPQEGKVLSYRRGIGHATLPLFP